MNIIHLLFLTLLSIQSVDTKDFYASSIEDNTNLQTTFKVLFKTIQHTCSQIAANHILYNQVGPSEEIIYLSGVVSSSGTNISIINNLKEEVAIDDVFYNTSTWFLYKGNVYKTIVPEDFSPLFVVDQVMAS